MFYLVKCKRCKYNGVRIRSCSDYGELIRTRYFIRKRINMAVVGYCVKCKDKKEMVNPTEGVTKNGRVITKGTCPECGTKMSLIGGVAKK